jgi:hypothetical protein
MDKKFLPKHKKFNLTEDSTVLVYKSNTNDQLLYLNTILKHS